MIDAKCRQVHSFATRHPDALFPHGDSSTLEFFTENLLLD